VSRIDHDNTQKDRALSEWAVAHYREDEIAERDAWENLVAAYHWQIQGMARKRAGGAPYRDIAQETNLRLLNVRMDHATGKAFGALIKTVIARVRVDWFRKQGPWALSYDDDLDEDVIKARQREWEKHADRAQRLAERGVHIDLPDRPAPTKEKIDRPTLGPTSTEALPRDERNAFMERVAAWLGVKKIERGQYGSITDWVLIAQLILNPAQRRALHEVMRTTPHATPEQARHLLRGVGEQIGAERRHVEADLARHPDGEYEGIGLVDPDMDRVAGLRAQIAAEQRGEDPPCLVCGNPFKRTRSDKLTCSSKCQKALQRGS
jgi:DNA-directed RNA polymerase specialized sigma24 family protein